MPKHKSKKKLLEELLYKGYGEDERKKWREKYRKNLLVKLELQKKKKTKQKTIDFNPDNSRIQTNIQDQFSTVKNAAKIQKIPDLKLRRLVDSYAYKNKFKITKFRERLFSLFTIINPGIKDYVNRDLIKFLVAGKGFKNTEPKSYCLLDNLDALFYTSGYLTGNYRQYHYSITKAEMNERIGALQNDIKKMMPFAMIFFNKFRERDEKVIKALELIKLRYNRGADVETELLSSIVRFTYSLIFTIGNIEPDNLDNILSVISILNKNHEPNVNNHTIIDSNINIFKIAYYNLTEYVHQLFPSMLKFLQVFFPEYEIMKKENIDRIYIFLGITEEQRLTYRADWGQNKKEEKTKEQIKEDQTKIQKKDMQNRIGFVQRFNNILVKLKQIFPESGIENIAKWQYLLPYFDLKIFKGKLSYHSNIELINSTDSMGQIFTLHRIIDNMLSSISIYDIDRMFSEKNEYKDSFINARKDWHKIYINIFAPYQKEINNFAKYMQTNNEDAISKPYIIRMIESINQIKNLVIKHYGNIIQGVGQKFNLTSLRVYKITESLSILLNEIREKMNKSIHTDWDQNENKILEDFEEKKIIDFNLNEEKPVIKLLIEFLENEKTTIKIDKSIQMQLSFFNLFTDIVDMYDFLLNDRNSFYRDFDETVILAGTAEKELWEKMKEEVSLLIIEAAEVKKNKH